jgi:hypothetical protein
MTVDSQQQPLHLRGDFVASIRFSCRGQFWISGAVASVSSSPVVAIGKGMGTVYMKRRTHY